MLSDYGKGLLGAPDATPVLAHAIAVANAAGTPVVVDPKGTDYTRYRGADLLTPNRNELREATRLAVDGDAAIVAAARHLIETCGVGGVLVTRGADGMTLVPGSGDPVHLLAQALSGASESRGKVLSRAALADRVAGWRQQGLTIGFTNGCFDLIHPGHISLLDQSAAACDRLVVAINTDASVARLKGPSRPVQNEASRALVLASLASVDAVVTFDEDTPLALIELLHPDVLVKGADYARAEVVGGDVVEAHGGRVLLARLEAGFSTTATIARIAQ